MNTKKLLLLVGLAAMTCLPPKALAGNGFPSFGAWAYGTSGSSYGFSSLGLHRASYRYSYRPSCFYRSANMGYSSIYLRPSYHTFFSNYSCGYPTYYNTFYRSYRPAVYVSPIVVPRVYYAPACYPTYSVYSIPIYSSTYYGTPLCSTTSVGAQEAIQAIPYAARRPAIPTLPEVGVQPSAQLVSATVPHVSLPGQGSESVVSRESVPAEILDAADAILRAGGYREAATAYAQLSVRYGVNETLMTRRFIAQIVSDDLEQAVLISASADLAGVTLSRDSLPARSLQALGVDQQLIASQSEALAARAYQAMDDHDALQTLGTWLHLAGDDERSKIFVARAKQLSSQAEQPAHNSTEFVSVTKSSDGVSARPR
ncbi:MAG: hypothetical protein R3C53_02675 [Pirellulaceae bacterium]